MAVASKDTTLILTEREAQFLADLLAHVGGDPYKSRRKYAANISHALSAVKIQPHPRTPDILRDVHCVDTARLIKEAKNG
jgi:hypothetical protein